MTWPRPQAEFLFVQLFFSVGDVVCFDLLINAFVAAHLKGRRNADIPQ